MVLSDLDVQYVQRFVEDERMFEVIKRVLLDKFDLNVFISLDVENQDNETLGENIRACLEGRERIEECFKELHRMKLVEQSKEKENPAR